MIVCEFSSRYFFYHLSTLSRLTLSVKGFPIDEENRLALDRVKSISSPVGTYGIERVTGIDSYPKLCLCILRI